MLPFGKPFLAMLLLVPCLARAGAFRLTSPDFADGALIPSRFTCEGENIAPALEIAGVPPGARSLALIVEDPDAPAGTFTHWMVWNIPPDTKKLFPGALPAQAVEGVNDFGNRGYSGPCPPSGTHRYFFRLSALGVGLSLHAGASRRELDDALAGHTVGKAVLMGRYARGS